MAAPPDEILDIIWPALQVGTITGLSGLTIGAFAGVIRATTPTLFALASGIQWFTLGTTFWASRGAILHTWARSKDIPTTPQQRTQASGIAGALSGAVGGALRGRKNILPGAVMFALFGAAGQVLFNSADARKTVEEQEGGKKKKSWLDSKWSPMSVLSDGEYRGMLREKILRVTVELEEVEEGIRSLRGEVEREKGREKEEEEGSKKLVE